MANYRDDRDALRNKADVLASELEGTKAELEQAEAENEAKDAEIARLRKLAGEKAPGARGPLKNPFFLAALGFGVAMLGAVAFLTTASRPAPTSSSPRDVEPQAVAPSLPEVPARVTKARFGAKVAKVTGRADLKVGDPCSIEVASPGGNAPFQELVVTCGSSELYRLTNRAGTVMSMSRWSLPEAPGGFGLEFEDVGQRSSDARAQIAIASGQKAGRVFTEGAVPTEVALEVDAVGKAHD